MLSCDTLCPNQDTEERERGRDSDTEEGERGGKWREGGRERVRERRGEGGGAPPMRTNEIPM